MAPQTCHKPTAAGTLVPSLLLAGLLASACSPMPELDTAGRLGLTPVEPRLIPLEPILAEADSLGTAEAAIGPVEARLAALRARAARLRQL